MRWVTTSIARFDPDIDWPLDLHFSAELNPLLVSYDGLTPAAGKSMSFDTVGLSAWISNVVSAQASKLTDNLWGAFTGTAQSNVPEVPPDGVMSITFSYPVDLSLVAPAIKVLVKSGKQSTVLASLASGGMTVSSCDPSASTPVTSSSPSTIASCLQIKLTVLLDVDAVYQLQIPKGTRYHPLAGPLGADLFISFTGLVSFKFPFNQWDQYPSYRRVDLWLRHGLSASVDINALAAQFSFSPALPITVTRPGLGYVRISAPFQPKVKYTLTVQPSSAIRDGYQLPLLGSSCTFTMSGTSPLFMEPAGYVVLESVSSDTLLEASLLTQWPVLSRGSTDTWYQPQTIRIYDGSSQAQLDTLLAAVNVPNGQPISNLTPFASASSTRSPNWQQFNLNMPTGALFGREISTMYSASTSLTAVTDLMVSAIVDSSYNLLVWVTRHSTGANVPSASVTVYQVQQADQSLKQVATQTLGSDGTAVIPLPPAADAPAHPYWYYTSYVALVQTADGLEMTYVPSITFPSARTTRNTAVLISDRALYKPGDTVYIKGYVRRLGSDDTQWSLVDPALTWKLSCVWSSAPNAADVTTDVEVVPSSDFGSFSASFVIPLDASYGVKSITLFSSSSDASGDDEGSGDGGGVLSPIISFPTPVSPSTPPSFQAVNSAYITLADPRRPTSTLALTTTAKIYRLLPAGVSNVTLKATVNTQSGLPINNAKVTLKWTLNRADLSSPGVSSSSSDIAFVGRGVGISLPSSSSPSSSASSADSGLITMTTDADGTAELDFSLETLLSAKGVRGPSEGDSLSLDATFVGPTGELLESSVSLDVSRSEWSLIVEKSMDDPLPGFPFKFYVDVQDFDDVSIPGVSVSIRLFNYSPNITSLATRGLPIPDLPILTCTAVSDGGIGAQCETILPTAARYVAVVSAVDGSGPFPVSVAVVQTMGQSMAEWVQHPLAAFDAVSMQLDRKGDSYSIGDTAHVSFYCPFQGASVMLRWGDQTMQGHNQLQASVTVGWNSVPFTLGSECIGGCRVMGVLMIPRQNTQPLLPVPVPISILFDFAGPRVISETLDIIMPDRNRDIKAAITFDSNQDVYAPGDSVATTVTVKDPSGRPVVAEVAFVAVDQAFLDLLPYPLHNPADDYKISLLESFSNYDTARFLVDPEVVRSVLDVDARRLNADPWSPVQLPTRSNGWFTYPPTPTQCFNDVAREDQSDDVFFAAYVAQLTQFPSYGYSNPCPALSSSIFNSEILYKNVAGGGGAMMMRMEKMSRNHHKRGGGGVGDGVAAPAPAAPSANLGGGGGAVADAAVSLSPGGGGAAASGGGSNTFPVRTQFETVPLFMGAVRTNAQGVAHFTVPLPSNIGRFALRAYVVDLNHRFGSSELLLTTRRPLSLDAMLPRIARVGDSFLAGVTVTSSDPNFSGSVSVRVHTKPSDNVTPIRELVIPESIGLTDETEVSVNVVGTTPVKARFWMEGYTLGDSTLSFSATATDAAAAQFNDAMENSLTVKPVQNAVTVATSFALHVDEAAGQPDSGWQEGLVFPPAQAWTGVLNISAGVGRYTALSSLASLLTSAVFEEQNKLTGDVWASRALLKAAFIPYGSAASGASQQALLDQMFPTIIEQLTLLTSSDLGLKYSNDNTYNQFPDVRLNSFAIIMAQQFVLGKSDANIPADLVAQWRNALQTEMVRQALQIRAQGGVYSDWETLAQVRLALGTDDEWNAATNGATDAAADLSLARLVANVDDCSARAQALIALIYLQRSIRASVVDTITNSLYSALRVQGRTAYLSYTGYSDYSTAPAQPLGTQGLALWALVLGLGLNDGSRTLTSNYPLIEKLANYVSQGNSNSYGFWMYSSVEVSLAAMSLSYYDLARGNNKPHIMVQVESGDVEILSANFRAPTDPVVSSQLAWEDLTQTVTPPKAKPDPLQFNAKGTGESSVAVTLQFVPQSISYDPVYRGMYLEKLIRRVDPLTGKPTGSGLQVVEMGAIVDVLIQVTSPDTLYQVMVEDLIPAGLEPLDPNVQRLGTSSTTSDLLTSFWSYWYWWQPFSAQETLSDRVRWSSYYFAAGAHSISYRAIAVTQGVFALPPAKAWATGQPEVMGLSGGGTFLVSETLIEQADIADYLKQMGVQPNVVVNPKQCSAQCTASQTCNVRTGMCQCFNGAPDCKDQTTTTPVDPSSPDCPNGECVVAKSSGMSDAAKAGVAFSVLAIIALAAIAILCRRRRSSGAATAKGKHVRSSSREDALVTSHSPPSGSRSTATAFVPISAGSTPEPHSRTLPQQEEESAAEQGYDTRAGRHRVAVEPSPTASSS